MTGESDLRDRGFGTPLAYAYLTEELLRDFAAFSCGDEEWQRDLREFLLEDALQQSQGRFSVTFVFYTESGEPAGFATLAAAQVSRSDAGLGRRAPYPVVPAVLIGRLGIDVTQQGKGYGQQIMALIREWSMSLPVGCRVLALQVDVRNEGAIRFYERDGFTKAPIEVQRTMQWMFYDLEARP
ncbi:MAG: GNAT family N-acetyltransferase [Dehalococcoidia bacterium]